MIPISARTFVFLLIISTLQSAIRYVCSTPTLNSGTSGFSAAASSA